MLSSLFLLTDHGEVIIEMQFHEKVPRSAIDGFWDTFVQPLRRGEEGPPTAVLHNGMMFVHTRRNNVVLLGTTAAEGASLLVLEELALVARVLTAYLKEFSEYTVRENFSLVYQLLQEVLDSGYPLNTELHSLEELVPRPTLENKVRSLLDTTPTLGNNKRPLDIRSRSAVGYGAEAIPWRDPNTHHNTNEILFDIVESLDYIIDCEGRIVKAAVRGTVEAKCRLSGMPDVLVRLFNMDAIDDVGLHRCVRLPKYESDRVISFVPPDGRFTLMHYTCKPTLSPTLPPFYVTPQVTFGISGGRFNCMVGHRRSGFSVHDDDTRVERVCVRLVLPPHTAAVTVLNCSKGTTSFDRSKGVLSWWVGSLARSSSPSLGGEFVFDNTEAAREVAAQSTGAAASVEFEIPNLLLSGLRVESMHVQNEIGKPYKGVKYITRAGNFSVRTM